MFLSSQHYITLLILTIFAFAARLFVLTGLTISAEMATSWLLSGSIALFLGIAAYTINQPTHDQPRKN